jgi:hypothetical protein
MHLCREKCALFRHHNKFLARTHRHWGFFFFACKNDCSSSTGKLKKFNLLNTYLVDIIWS